MPSLRTRLRRSQSTRRRMMFETLERREVLDGTYHALRFSGPYVQSFEINSSFTTNDNWNARSLIGYDGAGLVSVEGVDPQTVLQTGGNLKLTANATGSVIGGSAGGIARFTHIDPTLGLRGHSSVPAPHLVIHIDSRSASDVRVQYKLRDIDGTSGRDSTQPFALQYRIGTTGNFVNVPEAFIADATSAGATTENSINVVLPPEVNNQPQLQIRIITTNAVGTDEWVGIDDINISATINSPPLLTIDLGAVAYTEDSEPLILQPSATVSDTSSADFEGGTLTVSFFEEGTADDRLEIIPQGDGVGEIDIQGSTVRYEGTPIGTFSGGQGLTPLVITFDSAAATPAAAQALVRRIGFRNVSHQPSTTPRTVSFQISDGDGGIGGLQIAMVNVIAVDDAPQINLPGPPATVSPGDGPVLLDALASIGDADATALNLATLSVAIGNDVAGDLLTVRSEGDAAGQIDVINDTIHFGGTAVATFSPIDGGLMFAFNAQSGLTAVQALLRALQFSTTAMVSGPRNILMTYLEADGTTSQATTQVVVDAPPSVSISDANLQEADDGTQLLSFTVTLSASPGSEITIAWQTADDAATTADNDYVATSGNLVFTPGGPLSQTLAITIAGDPKFETDEQFFVNLLSAPGATIADGQAIGIIVNDDLQPTVAIANVSQPEGTVGAGMIFTVSLSHPSYQAVVVDYATADGTATVADDDYQSAMGSLTFAAGTSALSQTVAVTIQGDRRVEPDEQFTLNATVQNAANSSAAAIGELANDDAPPAVSFGESAVGDDGLDAASDSGAVDRITNVTLPRFWGRADIGASVELILDANQSGILDAGDAAPIAATVDETGRWEADTSTAISSGAQRVFAVARDAFGNVSTTAVLEIFVDTRSPQVERVSIAGHPDFALLGPAQTITPLIMGLSLSISDLPARGVGFQHEAIDHASLAATSIALTGQRVGTITPAQVSAMDTVAGESTITLTFAQALPDDDYTLTLSGNLADIAGNVLAQAFTTTFTVDSRAEVGASLGATTIIDINGNTIVDVGSSPNEAGLDVSYVSSFASNPIFSGNFAVSAITKADGFDKLAWLVPNEGRAEFAVDVDHDGVPDNPAPALGPELTPLLVAGQPIAGRFDASDDNGDEVGLFDGTTWYFDTNHNFILDSGDLTLASALFGAPIVGDFDGDGFDDLATYTIGAFQFDLTQGARQGWDGIADYTVNFLAGGDLELPVAADIDADGIDDLAIWTAASGFLTGVWVVLTSDGQAMVQANVAPNDPSHRVVTEQGTGQPAFDFRLGEGGQDLVFEFGDANASPLFGNFARPTVAQPGVKLGTYTNTSNPLDVDGDTFVTLIDAALAITMLNAFGSRTLTSTDLDPDGPYYDVSGDQVLTPLDVVMIITHINAFGQGQPQAAALDEPSASASATQAAAYFQALEESHDEDDAIERLADEVAIWWQ